MRSASFSAWRLMAGNPSDGSPTTCFLAMPDQQDRAGPFGLEGHSLSWPSAQSAPMPSSARSRATFTLSLHRLPRDVPGRFRLLIRPGRSCAGTGIWRAAMRPGHTPSARDGRAPSAASTCWSCAWHQRTRAGAAAVSMANCSSLGIGIAASAVREILRQAGTGPASERTTATWAGFLRCQAGALLACDFECLVGGGTVPMRECRGWRACAWLPEVTVR